MVECVNNAAGYATMALMHYLTWQRKRRFKVGIDATFNSEKFVRVSLFKGSLTSHEVRVYILPPFRRVFTN